MLCLMVENIHDSQWIVSDIFGPYLIDLLWKIYKNALTLPIFELEKYSFFKMGQNFARNWLLPLSECYCGTHEQSAASDKDRPIFTKGHIRAHCGGGWGWVRYRYLGNYQFLMKTSTTKFV